MDSESRCTHHRIDEAFGDRTNRLCFLRGDSLKYQFQMSLEGLEKKNAFGVEVNPEKV